MYNRDDVLKALAYGDHANNRCEPYITCEILTNREEVQFIREVYYTSDGGGDDPDYSSTRTLKGIADLADFDPFLKQIEDTGKTNFSLEMHVIETYDGVAIGNSRRAQENRCIHNDLRDYTGKINVSIEMKSKEEASICLSF